MKKKNLNSLILNKKVVSNFDYSIKGGANSAVKSCVNYTKEAGGCHNPNASMLATQCHSRCINACINP